MSADIVPFINTSISPLMSSVEQVKKVSPFGYFDDAYLNPSPITYSTWSGISNTANPYANPRVRTAVITSWHKTPYSLKPLLLEKLVDYESLYGISSQSMFRSYQNDEPLNVPYTDLQNWLNTYKLYE